MKTCSYCHRACEDGSVFCQSCGARLPSEQTFGYTYTDGYSNPQTDPYGESSAIAAFVLGIISLALSYMPFFSIASIICGAIGINKSGPGLQTCKRVFANLGKIFGIIGLSIGIFFTVFWLIYWIIIVSLISSFGVFL